MAHLPNAHGFQPTSSRSFARRDIVHLQDDAIPVSRREQDDDDDDISDVEIVDDRDSVEPDDGILPRGAATAVGLARALPLPDNHALLDSAVTPLGDTVRTGTDVELDDGDFLRVKRIVKSRIGQTIFRGILFRRAHKMDKQLRMAQNEVCALLLNVRAGIADPSMDDCLVDVELAHVGRVRQVILTNLPFAGYYGEQSRKWHDHSFRDGGMQAGVVACEFGVLCCRWKRVEYDDIQGKRGWSGAILALREHESDHGKGIPDAALVYWWRELEADGGAPSPLPPGAIFDLTDDGTEGSKKKVGKRPVQSSPGQTQLLWDVRKRVSIEEDEEVVSKDIYGNTTTQRRKRSHSEITHNSAVAPSTKQHLGTGFGASNPNQAFNPEALVSEPRTHFDFFAGPGGMATGAQRAGSVIKWLLEKEADQCNTLRLVFGRDKVLQTLLGDFFHKRHRRSFKTTTAHASPPCDTYAGCHTVPGKNDLQNEDSSCAIAQIVRSTRAKVLTFEQTDGMVRYRNKNHLHWRRMQRDIQDVQYSQRWKIMDATEHSCAAKRTRLIVLTSCPGHPLPDFPEPRAGPKATLHDILARVGPQRDLDPWMLQHTVKDTVPYDDRITLQHTITGDGGSGDKHPSGGRSLNMQELAMAAGFPRRRRFARASKTRLREMIGDAVPVGLAEDVYKMVHKSLDDGEAEMVEWLAGAGLVEKGRKRQQQSEVIVLDEDEEVPPKKRRTQAPIVVLDDDDDRQPQPEPKKLKQAPITLDDDDVIMLDD